MQDQVRQLRQLDVPCACLNHTVQMKEWRQVAESAQHSRLRILYVAPETLLRPEILLLLEQSNLACLAVDEAHCISEWGHDFRPEYRQLSQVRPRFPRAVCVALTATATTRVREDIRRLLTIPAEGEFVGSFNRPNLFLKVEPNRDELAQVIEFLQARRGEAGIIYCGTRKQADELCAALAAKGWPSLPYHAGLDDETRRRNQERFINDEVPLIVATIAFGMGINKSNVRFVVHAHLPKDVESYYQEIGRAGRDGLPARCLLLHSRKDAAIHRHFIDSGASSERAGRQARLNAMVRFAETRGCRRIPLLAYFGQESNVCGHCDNCTGTSEPLVMADVTGEALKLLECVKETGERFGVVHITLVLRGSKAERVVRTGHNRLKVHGSGKDRSTESWRSLSVELLHLGLVEQEQEFGGLRLTTKGRETLRNRDPVLVPSGALPVAATAAPAAMTDTPDEALFQKLRALRKKLAQEERVPPFWIFSDRSLSEMAAQQPQDTTAFLSINGVGKLKLARYGEDFLNAIRQFTAGSQKADHPGEMGAPALRERL